MAIEKNIKIKVDAKQGIKQVDELNKGVQDTSKAAKDSPRSFSLMSAGVKGVGLAFKAMGIGLIVSGFVALKNALEKNQTFLDRASVASAVFGDIMTKIGTVIMSVIKGLGLLGKAVGKVLKGDFAGAADLAKESFNGVKDAVVGNSESFGDYIKKAKESAKESVKFAKALVNLRNEVKLAEAQQRQLQLTYQRDAELQRQIRDDTSLTIEERIKANEKLGSILDEQFAEEKALAQKKIDLAALELSRNKDNIDLQVALIDAKTEMADLDERITGQRSEQLTNLKALEKEQADAKQAEIDAENKRLENIEAANQKELELARKKAAEKKAIEEKEAADALAILNAKIEADKALRIGAAKNILSSVAQLAGEGTKAAKAAALAGILIDTAKGVSGAIAAGAGLPFPLNLGAIATGVASVLAGIVQAKAIFAKVPGPGDVSTPNVQTDSQGAGGIGPLTPNVENIQGVELGGGDNGGQVQAYVVENDISNAQALQEELDLQATL